MPLTEPERLLKELEEAFTSHARRRDIGDRLRIIGDPRPGVGLRFDGLPDIVWCDVPAGAIRIEGRAFPVKPFQIGKYPITHVQYQSFVKDPMGYANKEWWQGLAQRQDQPGQQQPPIDNYPADNVSWYDAVAFCRWLSARLGKEIRLPAEWEWQQAATGGNSENTYPWGKDWEGGARCNTEDSGLGGTIAVGMYPHGASPVGVLDMAGNVWEWCLNEYDSPANTGLGGDAKRVLRGGSWYDYEGYAACASRGGFNPHARSDDLGFRCARVPHL